MTLRYRENLLRQQSNGIKSRKSGFTLIEVMVALAVFAVVGLALTKNASLAVVQTTRMQEQMLASMVAQNVLRERLARGGEKDPFTRTNREQQEIQMADRRYQVITRSETTDNDDVKRVTVSVRDDRRPDDVLAEIVGFVGRH